MSHTPETALTVYAGDRARARLSADGWSPELFHTLLGASGGAKLLGIAHLDGFLFSDFLQRSQHPMALIGSSIGTWRHAALACPDPGAAIATLQTRYLNQSWEDDDRRPRGAIVDGLCEWVMDGLATEAASTHICKHPRFSTYIVTSRGKGLNGMASRAPLAAGMFLSALGNGISRTWLEAGFQRVVFHCGADTVSGFDFRDFDTIPITATPATLRDALLASGSIPFLMSGKRDIPGAPPGHYWDGGIIDYHFDFANHTGDGLVLYPHFASTITPGWFDKALAFRRATPEMLDNVVLLAPSPRHLAALPNGKLPNRNDFGRFSQAERQSNWQRAMDLSMALADDFRALVDGDDPLRGVRSFRGS